MKVVCFGDSITYGQHLAEPTDAWPFLLRGHEVTSAGVPGDTTRLGLERFPAQVQQSGADTVVIQFGHNDANRWQTDRGLTRVYDRGFSMNLEEMVYRAREFGITPMLCSITPTFRSPQHVEDCKRYDLLVREVADIWMVPLIDVRAAFLAHPAVEEYLMADGLHLSERGHEVYAATVQEALDTWRSR